jgi:Ca-activated chloride channel homolog
MLVVIDWPFLEIENQASNVDRARRLRTALLPFLFTIQDSHDFPATTDRHRDVSEKARSSVEGFFLGQSRDWAVRPSGAAPQASSASVSYRLEQRCSFRWGGLSAVVIDGGSSRIHSPGMAYKLLLSVPLTFVSLFTFACAGDDMYDASSGGYGGDYLAPAMPFEAFSEEPNQALVSNPYTRTTSDPFSTFAADVDTASYDLYRSRLHNDGVLPDPTTVRTEEFINSFEYEYPAPSSEEQHPFRIDLHAAPGFFDTPRALLRVGIRAIEPEAFEPKPTNIAFLVDVSGSMQDEIKLPLVKTLLLETLEVLDPDDRVSIVTYAGNTRVALPSTAVSSAAIADAIRGLSASGSTSGSAGLDLAYEQVQQNFIEGGVNHVVLCTDGDFNVGPSSTSELVAQIERKRATGITFTVVGFGSNPNDAMMEAISNKGNGIYGVVGTEQQAKDYARERMLASFQLIAKDLKVQVEFNPKHVHAYRLLGYENRAIADDEFRDDAVDAGEVGAGHRVTALYELALTQEQLPPEVTPSVGQPSALPQEILGDDLVLVKVRYKALDVSVEDPAREVSSALPLDGVGTADRDLEWAGAVAAFAELLRGSPYVDMAQLQQIEGAIEKQRARDADRAEFVTLFQQARGLLERR